jgi:TolB-like protein
MACHSQRREASITMKKPPGAGQIVSFGPFSVDLRTGELYRGGQKIKLQEKPFQVLSALLERPAELVTSEEFRSRLRPADTFFDFDHSLRTAVSKLREALGDSPDRPRFIETVARRGYRFIAPLEKQARPRPDALTSSPTRVMVAVLPLENLTGDPGEEYFSDSMTEELITQLASLRPRQLGVIARSSSMRYKRTDKGIRQIGEELGVSYVVEGGIRRTPDRVRISAQLVQVSDQSSRWSKSYERELGDILTLQKEVAQAIAGEIRVKLVPQGAL